MANGKIFWFGRKNNFGMQGINTCLSKDELYPCTQLSNHSNRFITLSTCDYDGNYRILVVGERVEGEKIP